MWYDQIPFLHLLWLDLTCKDNIIIPHYYKCDQTPNIQFIHFVPICIISMIGPHLYSEYVQTPLLQFVWSDPAFTVHMIRPHEYN